MIDLNKIKLAFSDLTHNIYLIRHGKDKTLALDKKDFEVEVMNVITAYMMHGAPKGASKEYCLGDKWYKLTIEPINKPHKVINKEEK